MRTRSSCPYPATHAAKVNVFMSRRLWNYNSIWSLAYHAMLHPQYLSIPCHTCWQSTCVHVTQVLILQYHAKLRIPCHASHRGNMFVRSSHIRNCGIAWRIELIQSMVWHQCVPGTMAAVYVVCYTYTRFYMCFSCHVLYTYIPIQALLGHIPYHISTYVPAAPHQVRVEPRVRATGARARTWRSQAGERGHIFML